MLKKSIRFRITFIFITITALLIGSLLLVNQFFLADYYMRMKIDTLESAYESIAEIVKEAEENDIEFSEILPESRFTEDTDAKSLLRNYSEGSNIDVVILDAESDQAIGASREKDWLKSKLEAYIEFSDVFDEGQIPDSKYRKLLKTEQYTIQMNFDPRSGSNNLECWGTFPDSSTSFLMVMPVESILESITITSKFIGITGLILLVLGSVIIYFATAYITKPINRLAGISEKMSKLDFTEKYTGNHKDEIGVLGNSMNVMSEKLEGTISDLQAANAKLQEDIDLKEKIDVMRKDFISNVSHELKTPIALIEGYAEGLTEGIAEDPESRDYYCNVIMDEARKMNKMVRQLTSLTQYEFGAADLSKEVFDLSELLNNVLNREKMRLDEKNAKLLKNYPENLPVFADEFKIEEVFTNYLNNALNHLDGEMRIIIKAERISPGTIRLSVYNDGVKIPEDSLPHLWEKFYKVDKARTREYGGSGIGLSIVRAIAEAHGQEYGVTNRENGVEFYINLDAKK